MVTSPTSPRITAEMNINEVVDKYPQTVKVFFRYGMQCIGCYICDFHSIADSTKQWGVELEPLLNDLNDVVTEKGPQGFKNPEGLLV